MSLQTIIDNAMSIRIERKKLSGQTVSRSGEIRISSVANQVPWVMSVTMHPGLKYSTNRALVEELDRVDRVETQVINIGGSNPGLSYITDYQGTLSGNQLDQITIDSANATTIVANMSLVAGDVSSDIVFEPGDYIQPAGNYLYPYTVTEQVTRGTGTTVNVPINRPFITQPAYTLAGNGIFVGPEVTWRVVMTNRPSYNVVPYDRLEFSGDFVFAEVIGP
jgi:hypothetical protein